MTTGLDGAGLDGARLDGAGLDGSGLDANVEGPADDDVDRAPRRGVGQLAKVQMSLALAWRP